MVAQLCVIIFMLPTFVLCGIACCVTCFIPALKAGHLYVRKMKRQNSRSRSSQVPTFTSSLSLTPYKPANFVSSKTRELLLLNVLKVKECPRSFGVRADTKKNLSPVPKKNYFNCVLLTKSFLYLEGVSFFTFKNCLLKFASVLKPLS